MTPTAATEFEPGTLAPGDLGFHRYHIDLGAGAVRHESVVCADLDDALGGIARAYKLLVDRPVDDAYDPAATLILNLGVLSGTQFMTGLRTFFHAYSPLKCSKEGKPGAMWTAGSGKFGTLLRGLDVEEVLFTGRCERPTILRIHPATDDANGPAQFEFLDGSDLVGKRVNDKIQTLYKRFPDAHTAVIGPAGEAYEAVRFAAIALSTENQLSSGDPKPRFCGRGGSGGVMGSKNLLAIVADGPTPDQKQRYATLPKLNGEVARGKGSARFREKSKGGGGTWANYEALNPIDSMPEYNFAPSGTAISHQLHRDKVEEGAFVVKDEACYRCGIRCHKNVYDEGPDGEVGKFRAKLDFEPLNLLSSNIGIFDIDQACTLVELVDELGMDSISCGVTLSYAMEFNWRHKDQPEKQLFGGITYHDFEGSHQVLTDLGEGRLPDLGQGSKRLSEQTGVTEYAMHCKGMEFPAYLPQTNPGYPFALAGGHMSMRTYLLLLYERETDIEYWVDAITNRGPMILRDDILGVCKFSALKDDQMATAIQEISGLSLSAEDIQQAVMRAYLRGYRIERNQGFGDADYDMPRNVHWQYDHIKLPYFNTPEFFAELKQKVLAVFDERAASLGI